MSAESAETETPPAAEDELIAMLRTAAEAARELPSALDAALDVLTEAVQCAAGPRPPAPSPDTKGRRDLSAGLHG